MFPEPYSVNTSIALPASFILSYISRDLDINHVICRHLTYHVICGNNGYKSRDLYTCTCKTTVKHETTSMVIIDNFSSSYKSRDLDINHVIWTHITWCVCKGHINKSRDLYQCVTDNSPWIIFFGHHHLATSTTYGNSFSLSYSEYKYPSPNRSYVIYVVITHSFRDIIFKVTDIWTWNYNFFSHPTFYTDRLQQGEYFKLSNSWNG
jgi:hypothetical protein